MPNDTKKSNAEPVKSAAMTNLLGLVTTKKQEIKAENEAKKPERNKRRWKAERDPVAYEAQLETQRNEYAMKVMEEDGREVRSYFPVKDDAERLRRDAERQKENRANASQKSKDAEADRKWKKRQESAGKTPDQIEAGLNERRAQRAEERKTPFTSYEDNPNFGAF